MKKYRILIDLDGVMADWEGSVVKLLGLEEKVFRDRTKHGEDLSNFIPNVWDHIKKEGTGFWENLEKFPWADQLVNEMRKYGEVGILTSPGDLREKPESVAIASYGKSIWTAKNFPGLPLTITREKYFCADENTMLIDDSLRKVKPFAESGGMTYLWPHANKIVDGDIKLENIFDEIGEILNSKNTVSNSSILSRKNIYGDKNLCESQNEVFKPYAEAFK